MSKKVNTVSDNHFFKNIKFNKEFRCYEKGRTLEFKAGINLIVGEQGCGKSSLFEAIINNWQILTVDYDSDSDYLFLDTETMNPRLTDSFKAHREFADVKSYEKAEFEFTRDSFIREDRYKSHGQVMLPLLLSTKNVKKKTIFIDEPEAGLSIRSQYKLLNHYRELSKNNQLIIATHSLVLIKEVGEVLSLEHKKWMSADEFIESQKIN